MRGYRTTLNFGYNYFKNNIILWTNLKLLLQVQYFRLTLNRKPTYSIAIPLAKY